MTLKRRLHLSNLIYLALLLIVVALYISADSLINDLKQKQTAAHAIAIKIRETARQVDDYLKGTVDFASAEKSYASLAQAMQGSSLAAGLPGYWEKVEQFKLQQENLTKIEKEIESLTSSSIGKSNGYIEMVSQKLANDETKDSVSKLERLVISGANINTSANYEVKVRFLKLKANPGQKEAMLKYLDTLLANVERDVERLAKTPFAQMPVAARDANLRIKKLVQDFIGDLQKQRTIRADVAQHTASILGQLDQQNKSLINNLFSKIEDYFLILVIVLVAASLLGIAIAFVQANRVSNTLHGIVSGLWEVAQNTSRAAGQVFDASQSLAESSNTQAASLEETSASMEEMASMTRQNAEHSVQADGMMKEASTVVETAADSMAKLRNSIDTINAASDETAKIIKTIDEIAFQTNLLALNAAVEAARAGEAGAGFAVVADEVRNLAMRAAEAARNTSELIEGNIKDIKQSSQLVVSTDEAFAKVRQSASKVGGLVGEISAASQEQTQGIDQVNQSLSAMDKVTQQNAASAEESAAASEELKGQASQMVDLVNRLTGIVGTVGGDAQTGSSSGAKAAKPDKKPELLQSAVDMRSQNDDFRDF